MRPPPTASAEVGAGQAGRRCESGNGWPPATRMARAPRLTYALDMPEVTDGAQIPLRRQGSRDRASYANRPVGKGAFLAGEKIALRALLQPRMPASNAASRRGSRRVTRRALASALPLPAKRARVHRQCAAIEPGLSLPIRCRSTTPEQSLPPANS